MEAHQFDLGDNIFYGSDLEKLLIDNSNQYSLGATIFVYHVNNPKDYGIISFNNQGNVKEIIENQKNQNLIMLLQDYIFTMKTHQNMRVN